MGCFAGIIGKKGNSPNPGGLEKMLSAMDHRFEMSPVLIKKKTYHIGYAQTEREDAQFAKLKDWDLFDNRCIDGTLMPPKKDIISSVTPEHLKNKNYDGLSELSGVFTLLLLDNKNQRLYLALDHYGLKPLFWAETEAFLFFASEIKAINTTGFSINPTPSSLYEYLFQGLPLSNRTMQEGIYCFLPGTVMDIDLGDGLKTLHSFYTPEMHIQKNDYHTLNHRPEQELIQEFGQRLELSLSEMIRDDSKKGIFLSGGVDSSTIAALIIKQNQDILPCTIHVTEPAGISELSFARTAADYLGVKMKVIEFNGEIFRKNLVKTIYFLETPLILENSVALFAGAAELKSEGITVAIDGEGADSLFGGSTNVFKWDLVRYQLRRKLAGFGKFIENIIIKMICYTGKLGIKSFIPGPDRYEGLHLLIGGGGLDANEKMSHIRGLFDHIDDDAEKEIQTALLNEFYCYMRPCYQRLTQAAMAHQIEIRLPFMSQQLVQFCVNLPLKYRIGSSGLRPVTKYLLKKYAENYLPNSLLYRPKMGFGFPSGAYVGSLPEKWFKKGYIVSCFHLNGEYLKTWYLSSSESRDRFLFASMEIWGQMFIMERSWQVLEQEYLDANRFS